MPKNPHAVALGRLGGKASPCICGHALSDHREKREGLPREICLITECSCLQFKGIPKPKSAENGKKGGRPKKVGGNSHG